MGSLLVPFRCFLEILLTTVAVFKSERQFKLREGVATLSRFLDNLGTMELDHDRNCSNRSGKGDHYWRNIAITLKSMTPDEQLNELVSQRPELRSAIEASRHFWQRVFIGLAAIASVVILMILASALGLISLRFAVLFCAVMFAALVGLVIVLLVSGKLTFYSAKSTRN